MPRIEPNTMKTWELDEFFFHSICEDGLIVLCMTDKLYKRKQAFAFLGDVKKSLLNRYSTRELERATAHSLNTFGETIHEKIVSQFFSFFYKKIPYTVKLSVIFLAVFGEKVVLKLFRFFDILYDRISLRVQRWRLQTNQSFCSMS